MQNSCRHIVILGGGTAGTIIANRLARHYAGDLRAGVIDLTVVDENDVHVYSRACSFCHSAFTMPMTWSSRAASSYQQRRSM
jgi:NADH dehydrogenase FAD-containing subunit